MQPAADALEPTALRVSTTDRYDKLVKWEQRSFFFYDLTYSRPCDTLQRA